jgi:aspartyl-tRNA(Asn)/glutamyl-tRNA(Gln) amidotransferase subunit A
LSLTLGLAEPAPAVRAAIERAAAVFAELGAVVEPADPFPHSPKGIFDTLALGAFWALLRGQTAEAVALMDPGLVALCERGAAVTQEEYVAAVTRRAALGQAVRLFFDRFDLLLSPTMPIPAAYADPRDDGAPNPANFASWMPYTPPFNLIKNPSCSIPCGFIDGLPMGLQVTGPLFGDLAVLQACCAYEAAEGAPWPNPELTSRLTGIACSAGTSVTNKQWTKGH